jgi:hypothetical protein
MLRRMREPDERTGAWTLHRVGPFLNLLAAADDAGNPAKPDEDHGEAGQAGE